MIFILNTVKDTHTVKGRILSLMEIKKNMKETAEIIPTSKTKWKQKLIPEEELRKSTILVVDYK
jgi:hypothetical protein